MSGAWFARLRWRRRGAWLWPAFVALTIVDGLIAHLLPLTGDSQSFMGAVVIASFFQEESTAALGVSSGNVRVIRHRALGKLRACMEGT